MTKNKNKESAGMLEELQLKILKVQQGIWHKKQRLIMVFEGVDAAGKGGAIRKVTEKLDPRGFLVHPIGPPRPDEQSKHFLYRFWRRLPAPGSIAIFDRSWYGRVLVERVDGLIPKHRWKEAYQEINQFEEMLTNDGVYVMKFFLDISKDEQLKRFENRLNDPHKQWKITEDDIKARSKWHEYHKAFKDMFAETSTDAAPWHIIKADDKHSAREEILSLIATRMKHAEKWIQEQELRMSKRKLSHALKALEAEK